MAMDRTATSLRAILDQEWAQALDWYRRSDESAMAEMRAKLVGDDSAADINRLTAEEADVVCRLADLAFGELVIMASAETSRGD